MDSESSRRLRDVESLLIEILIRLPSRAATRFKSVCKQWNTLISSDYFFNFFNHRRHDPAESPSWYRLLLEFRHKYKYSTESYFSSVIHCGPTGSVRHQKLDLSFLPCRWQGRVVVNASFDDLTLCSYNDNPESPDFYLCNPQTKQWVALPSINPKQWVYPPFQLPPGFSLDQYITGLLCHHGNGGGVISNEFKFMVVLIRKAMVNPHQIEVVLFSSNREKKVHYFYTSDKCRWRNHVVSSPQRLNDQHQGNVVAYKGKLHWFNYPYVLVYDPYDDPDRISRVIELENNYPYPIESPIVRSIAVFHDRLRIVCSARDRQLFPPKCHYVLELEDYNSGTWRLVHEVRYTDLSPKEGHVLHDGNAFYWEKIKYCVRLCSLRNGVVNKDGMYELVPGYLNWPSYVINVHHIADLLPSPLPSFEWLRW